MANTMAVQAGGKTVGALLKERFRDIKSVVPKHVTPERVCRIALTEARNNEALQRCSAESLVGSVIQASTLGLEVGGGLGHAYLIPFKGQAQLVIGYRGMMDLAYRSGRVASIQARVVREGDDFDYRLGTDAYIKHIPRPDPGEITHAYAVAKLNGGGEVFEVLPKADIEAVKASSKGASRSDSPWNTHYPEMAKKSAVRRLFKYLPVSIEIQRAVGWDEMADAGIQQNNAAILDADFEEVPESRTDALAAEMEGGTDG